MPSFVSRGRVRLAAATALLAATALVPAVARTTTAASGAPAPVTGGADAAYIPGSMAPSGGVIPSEPADYDGDPLRVQATKVGRRALEPTIGVDKAGNAFFAASWHDDSKARVLPVTRVMRTKDGGGTWESVSPEAPVADEPLPPTNADPYVFVDPDTNRLFNPEAAGACLYTNISDDAGETWVTNPLVCGHINVDHQSFGAGPFPERFAGLKTVYPNVLYYCSNQVADAQCSRSLDGGIVWEATGTVAYPGYDPAAGGLCFSLSGHLETDTKGRLFLPKGHCSRAWVSVSEDMGATWTRVKVSDTVSAASTHIAMATDDADNVYVVWWDAAHRLPWLAVSKDSGRTFGTPMMVAPPGVREVNFPEIEAGEAGKVAIVFPGTTSSNRSDAKRPWNYYAVVTTNALDPEPLFVSTTANDLANPVHRGNCGPGRCGPMWDFIHIVISPLDGGFWSTLSDTCEAAACTKTGGTIDAVSSGEGVAVRQLGGPRIRTPKPAGS